MLPASRLNK